jgi:hypothetical protein
MPADVVVCDRVLERNMSGVDRDIPSPHLVKSSAREGERTSGLNGIF